MCVGFPGGARVKNLPANAGDLEAQFQSLCWEDYLERGMATHSILAWSITRTEEPGRLWSIGLKSWIRLNWLGTHSIWVINKQTNKQTKTKRYSPNCTNWTFLDIIMWFIVFFPLLCFTICPGYTSLSHSSGNTTHSWSHGLNCNSLKFIYWRCNLQ